MKKIIVITFCLSTLFAFQACKSKPASLEGFTKTQIDSVSYAVGIWLAQPIKQYGFGDLDFSTINRAIQDLLNDKELKISLQDFGPILENFMMKKQSIESEKNLKQGLEFLAKNKTKEGVVELPSGLQYKIIEEGTGAQPTADDTVIAYYKGSLVNGSEFDSSEKSFGGPATFPLSSVIMGWREGFQFLKEGSKAILYVPYELGYGEFGYPPQIPGKATLIFEVELIEVKKAENSK